MRFKRSPVSDSSRSEKTHGRANRSPTGLLSTSPGAIRARRYRQRHGLEHIYPVPAGGVVMEALLDRGLSEADSRNRTKVGAELGVLLLQWAKRWLAEAEKDRHA
jgi:hypothetical protein